MKMTYESAAPVRNSTFTENRVSLRTASRRHRHHSDAFDTARHLTLLDLIEAMRASSPTVDEPPRKRALCVPTRHASDCPLDRLVSSPAPRRPLVGRCECRWDSQTNSRARITCSSNACVGSLLSSVDGFVRNQA
jgi:hypothetical protein